MMSAAMKEPVERRSRDADVSLKDCEQRETLAEALVLVKLAIE